MRLRTEVTVKVKANMPFKKIFEVAEVCAVFSALACALTDPSFRNDSAKTLVRSSPPSHFSEDKGNDLGRV